jgi:hypothetical protein
MKQHLDELKSHSVTVISFRGLDKRMDDFRNKKVKLEEELESTRNEITGI